MRTFFAVFILLSFVSGCKNAEKNTKNSTEASTIEILPDTKVTEIAQGQNGGFENQKFTVIHSKEEFEKYWAIAYKNYLEKPELPNIDFEKENVILIAAGTQNSGGYNIYLLPEPNLTGQNFLFTVILEKPGNNCVVTEALTSPYKFYSVKKAIDPIDFTLKEKVIECK